MRAAGIRRYSDPVDLLVLPDPGELRSHEVLVEVRCCGIGNWDDIARTGGWDLGRQPPMALGVEAAGVIAGTGAAVHGRTFGSRRGDDPGHGGAAYRLDDAERALGRVRRGSGGQAVVLQVAP